MAANSTKSYRYRAFFSFSGKDREWVKSQSDGIHRVFVDEWSIIPGEDIAEACFRGIRQSFVFVAFLSQSSIQKDWPKREIEYALAKIPAERVIVVLDGVKMELAIETLKFLSKSCFLEAADRTFQQDLKNKIDSITKDIDIKEAEVNDVSTILLLCSENRKDFVASKLLPACSSPSVTVKCIPEGKTNSEIKNSDIELPKPVRKLIRSADRIGVIVKDAKDIDDPILKKLYQYACTLRDTGVIVPICFSDSAHQQIALLHGNHTLASLLDKRGHVIQPGQSEDDFIKYASRLLCFTSSASERAQITKKQRNE